jgi:hypothetical protein
MRGRLQRGWWQRGWLQHSLVAALLAWCLATSLSSLHAALVRGRDPLAQLDAEFGALASELPQRGAIGYLAPPGDVITVDDQRLLYAAQYALAPRLMTTRMGPESGPEFLIVARGTDRADDPRLAGYRLVSRTPGGHRVYRRSAP